MNLKKQNFIKAKELGFDFTPKEIETASTKVKKYRFFPKRSEERRVRKEC